MDGSLNVGNGVGGSRNAKSKSGRCDAQNSQVAKKRELDRLAQKKSRERARNRMLEMEKKLNRLQSDDKQKQITDLLKEVEDLRKENERLRSMHEKILALTNTAGPPLKARAAASECRRKSDGAPASEHSDESYVSVQPHLETWWDENANDDSPEASIPETSTLPANFEEDFQPDTSMDLFSPAPSEINPSFDFSPFDHLMDFSTALASGTPGQFSLTSSSVVPDVDKWRTSNEAFIFGIDTGKRTIYKPNIIHSQAAYKAILWGCDNVEEKERSHPLWLALRQVDEKVFGNWESKAQRIAMMFVCHRMLLYRANPCKETLERVPTFLRPRPSQETIQHPAVIDFLIWPGLRDRLVFSHKRYTSTGDFSAAFCENLHFHWPFPDEAILVFDPATQSHRISPLFEKYAFDLKNWTMNEGFFDRYMEMRDDIPCSSSRVAFDGFFDFMPMTA